MTRDELTDRLARSITDAPGLVVVTGPAGSGKTTLIEEALHHLDRDARVVGCDPLAPAVPYGPIRALTGVLGVDALRDLTVAPAALAEAITGALGSAVLVIEDVQWIDEASATLIPHLADRNARRGPMVLSIDPEDVTGPGVVDSMAVDVRLDVPPLSLDELRPMVPAGVDPVALLEATDGLALFAAEMADEGSVALDHRSIVLERFDRLTLSTRDIVETVAVSPTGSTRSLLDRLHPGWEANLAPAGEAGLVAIGPGGARIGHELIRRVLVGELTGMRRRFLHQRILEHLEESTDPAVVAAHADGAGAIETLIEAGWRAAVDAERAGSRAEALAQVERLLGYEHSMEAARREQVREALDRNRRS